LKKWFEEEVDPNRLATLQPFSQVDDLRRSTIAIRISLLQRVLKIFFRNLFDFVLPPDRELLLFFRQKPDPIAFV
jgi:hypothetical protein